MVLQQLTCLTVLPCMNQYGPSCPLSQLFSLFKECRKKTLVNQPKRFYAPNLWNNRHEDLRAAENVDKLKLKTHHFLIRMFFGYYLCYLIHFLCF